MSKKKTSSVSSSINKTGKIKKYYFKAIKSGRKYNYTLNLVTKNSTREEFGQFNVSRNESSNIFNFEVGYKTKLSIDFKNRFFF